jgi:hypothetical protein
LANALVSIVNGHLNSQIDELLRSAYARQPEPGLRTRLRSIGRREVWFPDYALVGQKNKITRR